ncbi:MAG: heparan-alpha-glucosaminide N-acetyltransferase domain-containing protein [Bacteroidota bacterium]
MTDQSGNITRRDGTADLLKGVAVLLMIQVHLTEQFGSPDMYNSMIGKISMFLGGPPCAPVFMAVMGYFLACSAKPLTYFLKRGSLLFLGGILLNVTRSANLLSRIMLGKADLDPLFFILGVDILALAGLSLILTGILRLVLKERSWLYFLVAIMVAFVSPLLDKTGFTGTARAYLMAYLWGTAEWSYFPLFPWFAYVLTGYAFHLFLKGSPFIKNIEIQNHLVYFIPLWIVIIVTLPYAAGITHNLGGPGGYYHHGILFYGWVVLFMIAYLILVKSAETLYGDHKIIKMIRWAGQKVTSLYVIQWIIIGNMATLLYKSQNLLQLVVWFVIVTAFTLLTGWLVQKIRVNALFY